MGSYLHILVPVVALVVVLGLFTAMLPKREPGTPTFARRATPPASAQLREDPNADLSWDRGGLLLGKRYWFVGTGCPPTRLKSEHYASLQDAKADTPVRISQANGRTWWQVGEHYYWESGGYSEKDVLALVRARERKAQQQLDRAHMLLSAEQVPANRRQGISREMKLAVWERDGGKCCMCGSAFEIQYDHIVPVAHGGATTIDNLQILCGDCNRAKGASF